MKNRIIGFLMIAMTFAFAACQKGGYAVEGKIDGGADLSAELFEMRGKGMTMGKTTLDKAGNFKIDFPKGLPAGLYAIKIGAKRLNLVLDGKEKGIKVEANLANLPLDYKVTGSEATAYYQAAYKDLIKVQPPAELLPKAGEKQTEQQMQTLQSWVNNRLTTMQATIEKAPTGLSAMLLSLQIQDFLQPQYLDFHKKIIARIEAETPQSPYAGEYSQALAQLTPKVSTANIAIGKPAPEIAFPSPNAETLSLSSLKGKVVLLDFWASWCGPCRRANPEVVALYNRFHEKGFEVFSVSLDENAEKWKAAIEKDGLKWKYHVSDLGGWNAVPAQIYGVQSIPQQYVIDRNGNIAAMVRPGESAAKAVEKLMQSL
ncbi:MAG: hypothetical protein RL757_1580 [Bacteroidota bacterium]